MGDEATSIKLKVEASTVSIAESFRLIEGVQPLDVTHSGEERLPGDAAADGQARRNGTMETGGEPSKMHRFLARPGIGAFLV